MNTSGEYQNAYTTPLKGRPYYSSSGMIYAVDEKNDRYAVCRIDQERYDDQNYQYIFTPVWNVIDVLPPAIFQGIPGLDFSVRKERYYRVNMTPCFISERTPGEGREDLWELLGDVGLDYYDRFEWLLRTDMRCGTDNLIVERIRTPRRIVLRTDDVLPEKLQPEDEIVIHGLQGVATTSRGLRQTLLCILRSGARIVDETEGRVITPAECRMMLRLLLYQEALEKMQSKRNQKEGIETAKAAGKYAGRKRISVDPNLLEQIAEEFRNRRITEEEAMKRLGVSSRSTFYRRLKEIRKK